MKNTANEKNLITAKVRFALDNALALDGLLYEKPLKEETVSRMEEILVSEMLQKKTGANDADNKKSR